MMSHTEELDNTGNVISRRLRRVILFIFLILFLYPVLFVGTEAAAQQVSSPRADIQYEEENAKADFLFKNPKGFLGFRVGTFFPRAGSDLFDMVTRELTIEKSDFRALDIGFDGGFSLRERIDLVFSLDTSRRTIKSEFRYYVDERGMPITQTTVYSQTPLTAGIRYLPMSRGRQIGEYAWLQSRIVPYVSGGGGLLWYRFRQRGDFVDVTTLEIFSTHLESSGCVTTVYLGGGADIHLFKSAYLNLDLRYSWANHELEGDFVGFEPIDLSGLRATAGIHWLF